MQLSVRQAQYAKSTHMRTTSKHNNHNQNKNNLNSQTKVNAPNTIARAC
jgi:hypothetical protein